ncbi:MAG: sigma-54-dependent transcriptional regulator [bacterium]
MKNRVVVVVDDERNQREMLVGFLAKKGYQSLGCETGREAIAIVQEHPVDVVLTDYQMPGMTGLELLRRIRQINPEILVIVFTAYGTIEMAVQAMKDGAYHYLTKPVDLDELTVILKKGTDYLQLREENRELKSILHERFSFDHIVSASGQMEEVLNLVTRVARTDTTVLIRGESGTGKELIAQAIHFHSLRAERPLIKVNCAALPETLLESELFGHEKGSFTGAITLRRGRFEEADGGSIFLDEIGDISLSTQAKLLRVIQEKTFQRIGSNTTIETDCRILAATNRNLEELMKEGTFREDLYYRLNVVPIVIPPLRERKEDIPRLIEHFLKQFSLKCHKQIKGITREARDMLIKYDYPGNIRELENIIERAVVLTRHEVIDVEDLPMQMKQRPQEVVEPQTGLLGSQLSNSERSMILKALENHRWVQTRAAEELGISERVLRYKMKKHHIRRGR